MVDILPQGHRLKQAYHYLKHQNFYLGLERSQRPQITNKVEGGSYRTSSRLLILRM